MKEYGWDKDYIRKRITGAEGWVYANWARENANMVWGIEEIPLTEGYIKQEVKRLKDERTKRRSQTQAG